MSELVYESKGTSSKQLNDFKTGVLSSFVFAAYALFKVYSIVKKNRYYSPLPMSLDDQKMVKFYITMSIVFMFLVFIFIRMISYSKTCWVKVYQDILEAKTFTSILKIKISQIDYVQINKFFLFVTTGGKREKIVCEDPEKLYSVINGLMSH